MKSTDPLISIYNLVQNFGRNDPVLNEINLEIKNGEFLALVGQNGAGKTTLVKHLNGLLRPNSGSIRISGREISGMSTATLAQQVGYVFQNPDHQIFLDKVDKEVAFGPGNLGLSSAEINQKITTAMEKVGILHLKEASPLSLSKGQRQRVALASVLAMEPEILILDEPTTGQDNREAAQIMDLVTSLNKKGHTIIFITHDMQLVADYAKRVILLGQGKILADGTSRQVLSQPDLLGKTFLKPPQVTLLAQALVHHDIPNDIISVDELLEVIRLKEKRVPGLTLVSAG